MTDQEAVEIARRYLSEHDIRPDRFVSVVHVTRERLRNMYESAASQRAMGEREIELYEYMQTSMRDHWTVCFAFDDPPGVVSNPQGPVVLVYDDTGEAEPFYTL
jgi:predicted aminopeptidase